ncbi:MAG: diguanylate cyclase [Rhodocyclaceae bacterium]|nr:diguanylate cyclase [Rhodocyclaceae bacterium]MCP5310817.1 diguanylate cyclase [Zoogloeaceae bacterium]
MPSDKNDQTASPVLDAIVACNPLPTFAIDLAHRVIHWNPACEQLTGIAAAAIIGTRDHWQAFYRDRRPLMADLLVDQDHAAIERYYGGECRPSRLVEGGYEAEAFLPGVGSRGRWFYFTVAPLLDTEGKLIGAIESLQDVTIRRRAESAQRANEALLAQIIDGSSVPTFVLDQNHRVTHWNRACEVLTGMSATEVLGTDQQWKAFYASPRPVMADLIIDGAQESMAQLYYDDKYRTSALIEGAFEAEDFFPAFGESGRWVYFTAAPLRDQHGETIGAIETLQDITEAKRSEEMLRESERQYRHLSQTDSLTGLYNSRQFFERTRREIERATRYRRPLALLAMDADDFKRINDTHGHLEGDRVLQKLASAIRDCLRRTDSAYRYGGEEFMVLMPESSIEAAALVAERIRSSFADMQHELPDGASFHASVSIGVTSHVAGDSPDSLIKRADLAMYRGKRRGKNCVVVAEA